MDSNWHLLLTPCVTLSCLCKKYKCILLSLTHTHTQTHTHFKRMINHLHVRGHNCKAWCNPWQTMQFAPIVFCTVFAIHMQQGGSRLSPDTVLWNVRNRIGIIVGTLNRVHTWATRSYHSTKKKLPYILCDQAISQASCKMYIWQWSHTR